MDYSAQGEETAQPQVSNALSHIWELARRVSFNKYSKLVYILVELRPLANLNAAPGEDATVDILAESTGLTLLLWDKLDCFVFWTPHEQ